MLRAMTGWNIRLQRVRRVRNKRNSVLRLIFALRRTEGDHCLRHPLQWGPTRLVGTKPGGFSTEKDREQSCVVLFDKRSSVGSC